MGEELSAIIMAFARIASFLFFIPFLSGKMIPGISKVVIALALSFAVADKIEVRDFENVVQLVGYVVVQIGIGLTLAKIVEFMASIPKMAGALMDIDMGFAQATIMDPSTNQSNTILATALNMLFVLIFVSLNGVNQLIFTLVKSFELTETLRFLTNGQFLEYLLGVFAYMFVSAIQIALPIMGSMFVVNFVLMIMGKAAPQMQIFQNMFAVKITLGLIFIAVTIPILGDVFAYLTEELINEYNNSFNYLFKK